VPPSWPRSPSADTREQITRWWLQGFAAAFFFGWRGMVLVLSRCPYTVEPGNSEQVGDLLDGLLPRVVPLLGERGLVLREFRPAAADPAPGAGGGQAVHGVRDLEWPGAVRALSRAEPGPRRSARSPWRSCQARRRVNCRTCSSAMIRRTKRQSLPHVLTGGPAGSFRGTAPCLGSVCRAGVMPGHGRKRWSGGQAGFWHPLFIGHGGTSLNFLPLEIGQFAAGARFPVQR
jgi:hypothetical protein